MRTVFYFLLAASILSTQACIKMDRQDSPVTTTQMVDALVAQNVTYTYALPMSAKGSQSQISTPAAHASSSSITTDASGNAVYIYTPAGNFVGNDVVVITTKTEEQHGCGHCGTFGGTGNCNHGGNCGNHDDDKTTITTINLTVTASSTVVKQSVAKTYVCPTF
jgi:hypothetical protein